jgi:hypothetical protein
MAQSIYITLDSLKTETSVPAVKDKNGKILRQDMGNVAHTLPREHYPTSTIFDNEEQFLEWAQENNCLLALLQSGINDWLISDRAAFKRMVKGEWTPEIGQTNVNNRKWTISTKPAAAITKAEKAGNALDDLSPEELTRVLSRYQQQ